jgi:hypothetical protein
MTTKRSIGWFPERSFDLVGVRGLPARLAMRGPSAVRFAGWGTTRLIKHLPAIAAKARGGALRASSVVRGMSSATLRSLSAGSVGFGAGLLLGGAPRVVAAAGMAPAFVMSATLLARPSATGAADGAPPAPGPRPVIDTDRLDDDGGPPAA